MIHIVIHTLPQEINDLENLLIELKKSSIYIKYEDYMVEVVLNLHLTNWDDSTIDRHFFINKFNFLETLTSSWCKTKFEISDGSILGCNDIRRRALRTSTAEHIMYLDTDNIFPITMLYYMREAVNTLYKTEKYYIVTPQVTRMWDTTWDVISNRWYIENEPVNKETYLNRDPYNLTCYDLSIGCDPIDSFKFAGWGTCLSTKLRDIIDIPDSLGSYGLDDTFIMSACDLLKKKGVDVTQYLLKNIVIIENNKFRFNPYKDYISSIDRRQEFLKQAEDNFLKELIKYQ